MLFGVHPITDRRSAWPADGEEKNSHPLVERTIAAACNASPQSATRSAASSEIFGADTKRFRMISNEQENN